MMDLTTTDCRRDGSPLLVVDDEPFVKLLAQATKKRGFLHETSRSMAAGRDISLSSPLPTQSSTFGLRMHAASMSLKLCGGAFRTVPS